MPNTGTLTGLSPATSYILDAVHVDPWGNVSAVVSSDAFTTDAAPTGALTSFVESHTLTSGASVFTISGATLGTGFIQVGVAAGHASADLTIDSVTIDGVTATLLAKSDGSRNSAGFYQAASSSATGDIVVTMSGTANEGALVTIYNSSLELAANQSSFAREETINVSTNQTFALEMNVVSNGSVLAIAFTSGFGGGNGDFTEIGLTQRVATVGMDTSDTNDFVAAWDAHELAAETPRGMSVTHTPGDSTTTRAVVGAVSLRAA